ncbi:MAG: hypothetical protein VX613_05685 [Candidatus Thermoplasmatota archaeon]|nr:hypothetical protein [Candidatus Thermoplasmatota archaeon]
MPKIGKAARGKHRWIGLVFDEKYTEIKSVKDYLEKLLNCSEIKLYDYINDESRKSCIIKVKLSEYAVTKKLLNDLEQNIFSITSSGKIRLVRSRLDDYFQRQIDD